LSFANTATGRAIITISVKAATFNTLALRTFFMQNLLIRLSFATFVRRNNAGRLLSKQPLCRFRHNHRTVCMLFSLWGLIYDNVERLARMG
jgi:hypothetical protein